MLYSQSLLVIYFRNVFVSCSVMPSSLQHYGLYSPPGSSVHGILQARILEWIAVPFCNFTHNDVYMLIPTSYIITILIWATPVLLPGKSHGRRSLVGCSPWVGHDWATSLSLSTFMHWRGKWQPIPVFLPGESQGRGSLVGCRLWGRTELDTTEAT